MRKYLAILALAIFTIGFVSCTDDTTTDNQVYENAEDKDEEIDKD